jgi:UDP-N-acetylglucosamine 1-carboxyvinyltransferase
MKYLIKNVDTISGNLTINVGKNFLLNTIPGLLLLDGEIEIKNYIEYPDVIGLLEILNFLGVTCVKEGTSMIINTTQYQGKAITHPKAVIRSCFMIAGAMLTRSKTAYIPISYGWCTDMQSNKRACNFHLECFEKMGAKVETWKKDNGDELVDIDGKNMHGSEYTFPKVSVTGTVNTVLAALGCDGVSVLKNVSLEPEVSFAINLFQQWGFDIVFHKEEREIRVHGKYNFIPLKLQERLVLDLPSDRLLAGSFMMLPLMIHGQLHLNGIDIVKNNLTLIENLENTGAHLEIIDDHNIIVRKQKDQILHGMNIIANPYPAIATDLYPFLIVLAVFCQEQSRLTDNVYNTRALSISNFLQKFDIDIEMLSECDVIVKPYKKPITKIANDDYQGWLNKIQNIRGQTAAFFFLIATQKNFIIDLNTFASQIVRGNPDPYFINDLKKIGVNIEKID